jgi:hypothetical protein
VARQQKREKNLPDTEGITERNLPAEKEITYIHECSEFETLPNEQPSDPPIHPSIIATTRATESPRLPGAFPDDAISNNLSEERDTTSLVISTQVESVLLICPATTPQKTRATREDEWYTPTPPERPVITSREAMSSNMSAGNLDAETARETVLAAAKGFERAHWKAKDDISARFKGSPGEDAYGFLEKLKKEAQRAVDQGYFTSIDEMVPRFAPLFRSGASRWWGSLASTNIKFDELAQKMLAQYDERIPGIYRSQEVAHMKKHRKESSRDYAIRLKEANSRLGPQALNAESLKYAFLKGHPTKQQYRLEDIRIKGKNWFEEGVTFEQFTEEAYMKLDKKKRRRRRREDSETDSSSSDSSSSSSSESSDSDSRRKRRSKSKKVAFHKKTTLLPTITQIDMPVVKPDPEFQKQVSTLQEEMSKVKEELRMTGFRRGRGQIVHLSELNESEIEDEINRRADEMYLGEPQGRGYQPRPYNSYPQREQSRGGYQRREDFSRDSRNRFQGDQRQNGFQGEQRQIGYPDQKESKPDVDKQIQQLLEITKNLALIQSTKGPCYACHEMGHFAGDPACKLTKNDNVQGNAPSNEKHFPSRG